MIRIRFSVILGVGIMIRVRTRFVVGVWVRATLVYCRYAVVPDSDRNGLPTDLNTHAHAHTQMTLTHTHAHTNTRSRRYTLSHTTQNTRARTHTHTHPPSHRDFSREGVAEVNRCVANGHRMSLGPCEPRVVTPSIELPAEQIRI